MLQALTDQARLRTVDLVLDLVESESPGILSKMSLDARVTLALDGMERARAMGVPPGTGAIALYSTLCFLWAPDFDVHPDCRKILADWDLSPEARIFALLDPARGVPWQEIVKRRLQED